MCLFLYTIALSFVNDCVGVRIERSTEGAIDEAPEASRGEMVSISQSVRGFGEHCYLLKWRMGRRLSRKQNCSTEAHFCAISCIFQST